ncbi:hypothetical protein [Methylobacterium sp. WL8]|uniref:hypothetical protein n=1 Tax=Methylobacterium sp. WL8 TaxID=2603899 RepID=UPI0011C9810B|nr:hypothetical protein [Methylobacterium sp. WL8]TXN82691.1 hypothetical protein FV234_09110 [Methylobacterium sp. WL8]
MTLRTIIAWSLLALTGIVLAGTGARLLPQARRAALVLRAAEAPPALADLRLKDVLSSERVAAEIDAALAAEDDELAQSFIDLADGRGISVSADQRERLATLRSSTAYFSARAFAAGAMTGEADSAAGLAGTLAADVTGVGDIRDLVREAPLCARGDPACDRVVVGLATVGLATTATTWIGGLGLAARGGVTITKVARKMHRLSEPLTAGLTRMVRACVDPAAVEALLQAGRRMNIDGLRAAAVAAIRPTEVGALRDLGRNVYQLYGITGARGVLQALSLARSPVEVVRIERLAARFGSKTRATLKVLDRAALVLGAEISALVRAVLGGIAWCIGVALFCRRLGLMVGRVLWPRRPPADRSLEATRVAISLSAATPRPILSQRPVTSVTDGRGAQPIGAEASGSADDERERGVVAGGPSADARCAGSRPPDV